MKPLVSILIPAYNAEELISATIDSAIAQTWPRKEIIVVNDGSRDRTLEVVRGYASKGVAVVTIENRGLSAAQNTAFAHCQGDYIQWLDSDDLLAPDKIERQLAALGEERDERILLSSPWAHFYYRTRGVRFNLNSLFEDLSPVEWLFRKLNNHDHMQNATWLVSRRLTEAAGPWDESLIYDQDGEYFARVLLASSGTRFVPGTGIFYRITGASSISQIGRSNEKRDSLLRSIQLHIIYLRSLEDSDRVRLACIAHIQHWYQYFYRQRPDIDNQLVAMAAELGGHVYPPPLRWKYAWLTPLAGWKAAHYTQMTLPCWKASLARRWERSLSRLDRHSTGPNAHECAVTFLQDLAGRR